MIKAENITEETSFIHIFFKICPRVNLWSLFNILIFQLTEIEAEEFEAGIKNMEMKRQISYQTISNMAKKVRNLRTL